MWRTEVMGPVRLRIEMPAPSVVPQLVAVAVLLAAILAPVAYVVARGVAGIAGGLAIVGLYSAAMVFAVVWAAPWARHEVLEIDTRLVTVRRGEDLDDAWGRSQFYDVRLDPRRRERRFLGRRPTVVWGPQGKGVGVHGMGSLLTDQEALDAIEAICTFCDEHPADPDFHYQGPGIPPRTSPL